MHRIALLLKSYVGDIGVAERLLESFSQHNPTSLPLYCVVPPGDVSAFAHMATADITVMSEAVLESHLVTQTTAGLRPGYINQEIIKLAFHELGLAQNYFCVDSEAVFVRDLSEADFIAPDGHPYTVLSEDNELKVEPQYYSQYWQSREVHLRRIAELVGLNDAVLRTCHGHQILSSSVLESFRQDFLEPRGWDYKDALEAAPYEFTWYNFWLLRAGTIPIHQREPLIKVFHHEAQHQEYLLRGITPADIARGYLGYVVNSSFARELPLVRPTASKPEQLAPYLSYGETAALLGAKVRDTARRRLSWHH